MKLQCLAFLFTVLLMNACMWGVTKKQAPGITTDTLAYSYRSISKKAADCKNPADSACMIVKLKYPFFSDDNVLNDSVSEKLISASISENNVDKNLNQLAQNFVKSYIDFKKQQPDSKIYYMLNSNVKVIRQDSSIITLQINGYTFEGGAHGLDLTCFLNWNTKSNKTIFLNDVLTNGYESKLTAVADSIFRKSEKLSDTASLKINYFFKGGIFSLNKNFQITPDGLRFLYNEYEIKPYAAGQTDLLIPYAKIKSLLLPHTVISQYLK